MPLFCLKKRLSSLVNLNGKNAMNHKLAFAALIAMFAITPAFAREEGASHPQDKKIHDASAALPLQKNNATDLLAVVKKTLDASKAALDTKDLKAIHPHTSTGMEALKTLTTISVAPEKKERRDAVIKQMNSRLDTLHEAADANDIAKTASELKKAEGALKLLELQIKN
jgi:hypothetical protein